MYKELRPGGNDPDGWTKNFLGGSLPRMSAIGLGGNTVWGAITSRVPRGATILDAGSGSGEWVDLVQREGYHGIAVDYSPEMIGLMQRERPASRWLAADIRAIALTDSSVDAVISWGVVEHDEGGLSVLPAQRRTRVTPARCRLHARPRTLPAPRADALAPTARRGPRTQPLRCVA